MADLMVAGTGNDLLIGGGGNDWLDGGSGDDVIFGGTGDDAMAGQEGDDTLAGGAGNDHLYGGAGRDELWGDEGDDLIFGDSGDDTLHGGAGTDTLYGGTGDNVLYGGTGDGDILAGGLGADTYVYLRGDGADFIEGLHGAEGDRIDLADFVSLIPDVHTLAGLIAAGLIAAGVALGDGAGNTVLALSESDRLTIRGMTPETLTEDLFVFNLMPEAVDDAAVVREDRRLTIDVLANDVDFEGDALHLLDLESATSELGARLSIVDGRVVYDPTDVDALRALDTGESLVDHFSYTASDVYGRETTGTVAVTVEGLDTVQGLLGMTVTMEYAGASREVVVGNERVEGSVSWSNGFFGSGSLQMDITDTGLVMRGYNGNSGYQGFAGALVIRFDDGAVGPLTGITVVENNVMTGRSSTDPQVPAITEGDITFGDDYVRIDYTGGWDYGNVLALDFHFG